MKRLKQLAAVLLMTAMMTITSFAGQWMQDSSGWWYQNDDGSYPVSCWQWIDGNGDGIAEYYYFNENGYCLMNTMTPDGNIVDANGAWIIGGVVQTKAVVSPVNTQKTYADQQNTGIKTVQQETSSTPVRTEVNNTEVKASVEAAVWLSATGSKYHRIPNCGRMNPNKARQVSLDQAVAQGFERCKNCY